MNCSTISLARTATNGCSALNSSYLSAKTATTPNTAINGATVKSLHNTTSNGLLNNNNNNNNNSSKVNMLLSTNVITTPSPTPPLAKMNFTTTPKAEDKSKNIDLAKKVIKDSNIVCFDVDSTVIREEGIDELAEFCGKGSEVARVTKEAMGGSMTFQDALNIRLNIIKPSQQQITQFIRERPSTLTSNVKKFIDYLRHEGKQIYLISGGFDCLIEPVANEVGVPLSNLFANKLMFYFNGDYANFDTSQPTSKSGGKADAISIIKRQNPNALITMIGDGATDLEAVPPANYFIGFGGNIVRAEVQKRAQYYITDFEQLM